MRVDFLVGGNSANAPMTGIGRSYPCAELECGVQGRCIFDLNLWKSLKMNRRSFCIKGRVLPKYKQ